ncbi:rod shape-determining protein [Streptomyces megasporus]|uniref:rod shape-determining protein n=1 Tax=Streptomyces megasporus TaxID=44060 RepID=UPI00068B6912|nr:rod shape-determining protein [Streptomyces megasporus]
MTPSSLLPPLRDRAWPVRRPSPGLAVDLGSARTRMWLPGRGLIADAPTVVSPGPDGTHPVQRGSVVDVEGAARLLDRLLTDPPHHPGHRPVVVLATPVLCDDEHRAAALTALEVLRPRTVLTIDSVRAVALGASADLSEPLLVVDIGAHLTEVALLVDGAVVTAHRTPLGTTDLDEITTAAALADSVVETVIDILRDDPTAWTLDALERGVLLSGGGARRPEVVHHLARRLRAPVQPAPAPHTAAVRGAAAELVAARDRPTPVSSPSPSPSPDASR